MRAVYKISMSAWLGTMASVNLALLSKALDHRQGVSSAIVNLRFKFCNILVVSLFAILPVLQ